MLAALFIKYLFTEIWRIIDMILTVRLNSDDTKIYRLVSWDTANFSSGLTLTVQGNNLSKVSADFAEITKLEVY